MLKRFNVFLLLSTLIFTFAASAHARISWSNLPGLEGTRINFHSDKGAFDGGNFNEAKIITVPEKINDVPVTIIARDSFFTEHGLESITLPATVKEIHQNSFTHMKNIKEVIINSPSIYFIGDNFNNCPKLEKLIILADEVKSADFINLFEKTPNIVIYGKAGSAVEDFAKKYKVKFSPYKK